MRFHHLGVAVADVADALALNAELSGYPCSIDSARDEAQGAEIYLLRSPGQPMLEILAPLSSTSPVAGMLSRGIAAYHVCYEVPNIGAAIDALVGKGAKLVKAPTPAPAFEGRRVAFLLLPTKQLIELLEERC